MSKWSEPERLRALYAAIGAGHVELLEEAAAEGYDAKSELLYEYSIVSCAAEHSVQTLQRTVELVRCVDIREVTGFSPLLSAVASSNVAICRALLDLGASIEWVSDNGMNTLHWLCVWPFQRDLFSLLVSRATLHALLTHDLTQHTPITMAIRESDPEYVELLVLKFVELGGPVSLRVGPELASLGELLRGAGYDRLATVVKPDGLSR